ncbi:MAG: 30S ribosomal protein S6 [Acutalibacteraceae bacterium]|nr:30S ribosomal protein S6 [Acutalibacteraceae bacterium]
MAIAYETVLVFSVKNGEEAAKALVEKFTNMIAASGTVKEVDEWGKRRLAYAINYETEGYYVVINHDSDTDFVAELARVLNITDGVLRYLTVKK